MSKVVTDLTAPVTGAAPAEEAGSGATDGGDDLAVLFRTPIWSDALVAATGVAIRDAPVVTIGGGLASFALVDFMRVCGVSAEEIRVVSPQRRPHENLHHLMRRSQILDGDPLRSDSMSRVDNIWGFPSYAVEDAIKRRSIRPLWNVLTEPLLTEFFNPSPRQVFDGIDREAARIGWDSMVTPGRARLVRKRDDGGYFCLVAPVGRGAPTALRCRYVHLGTGYPAVNYAPEVSRYRLRHGEYFTVVNAYEPHEHVYEVLNRRAGTVVIRGSGITASRVLERLLADRERSGQDVRILHLFRTYVDGSRGPWTFRRPGGGGWTYQAFSFPKAAGSGQLRRRMLDMDDTRRAEYIKSMAGTTSAKRHQWQHQLKRGRAAGYYRALEGDMREMRPTDRGKVELRVDVSGLPANTALDVDFMIDCTGLRLNLADNPLLSDLLDVGGAARNPLGGFDVGPHFEMRGMDRGPGRAYASGVITRGGYLAPVDSFWGFSHAALEICDDMARRGFCARLGLTRSVMGWFRWLGGAQP